MTKKDLEGILIKQLEDIESLKKQLKIKELTSSNEVYTYKQCTINLMGEALAKAKKDVFIAKALLMEIYDSLNAEPNISIKDLLRYKAKIREAFPLLITKKTNITKVE